MDMVVSYLNNEQNALVIQKLYGSYSDNIYNFILLMIGDRHQAQDLMQDTFLRAFKSIPNFEGKSSEKTWLFRIARNVTVDFIRRKKLVSFVRGNFNISPTQELLPEELLRLEESTRELYFALSKLKQDYRLVIILRKVKELSIAETAQVLGWSEGMVKTTLIRALNSLKKVMEEGGYIHEGQRRI